MDGERSGVRDDGGPETSAGRYLDLRREDVLLLFRRMQGVVRSDSREVREVTSLLGRRLTGKGYGKQGALAAGERGEGPLVLFPFTWNRRLIRGPLLKSVVNGLLVNLPFHVP